MSLQIAQQAHHPINSAECKMKMQSKAIVLPRSRHSLLTPCAAALLLCAGFVHAQTPNSDVVLDALGGPGGNQFGKRPIALGRVHGPDPTPITGITPRGIDSAPTSVGIEIPTPSADPPICVAAASARARQSLAAPGLEAQCTAARAAAAAENQAIRQPAGTP